MKKILLTLFVGLITFAGEDGFCQIRPESAITCFKEGIALFEEYIGTVTTKEKAKELTLEMIGEFSKAFSIDANVDKKVKYKPKEKRIEGTFLYMLAVACIQNQMNDKAMLFINQTIELNTQDKPLYQKMKKELEEKKIKKTPAEK